MKTALQIPTLEKMQQRWAPLPTDLALRKYIIATTRGAWKGKTTIDAVAYQRAFRAENTQREEKLFALWNRGQAKKKKAERTVTKRK